MNAAAFSAAWQSSLGDPHRGQSPDRYSARESIHARSVSSHSISGWDERSRPASS